MPPPPRVPRIQLRPVVLPVAPSRSEVIVAPPRATPSRATPRASPPPVAPPIALEVRLSALVEELRGMKVRMNTMIHRTGVILRELQQPTMLSAAGCTTFEELLEKHDLTSRMTALKYIAVAETFSEPDAVRLGVDKSYALVRYADALGKRDEAPAILARNARIAGVPVLQITSAAISTRSARCASGSEPRARTTRPRRPIASCGASARRCARPARRTRSCGACVAGARTAS